MSTSRTKAAVRLLLSTLLLGFMTMLTASVAHAQQDAEKRIRSMNKQAMADYDSLEFEMSRKTLMDAVALIRASGLEDSPVAAKTYMNLGVVYAAGFKDRNRGLQQFTAALRANPQLKLDPNVATPDLEELYAAARKQVGAAQVVDSEPVSSDDVKGLAHSPVDEARPNEPLTIKALLGSGTGASNVFLLYRSSGQSDYIAVAMEHKAGAEWVGVIPADVVQDRPIQYYIEARDKKGRAVIGSGSAPNPYIVTIAETAPGARIVHPVAKRDDKGKFHHVFVLLMAGTGMGYLPKGNRSEIAYEQKTNSSGGVEYDPVTVSSSPGGVASAPFHIGVEIGGQITNHFSLSVLGRFQAVTGANAQTIVPASGMVSGASTRATGAVSGFLRARYRFLEGKFHPYIHIDFGGGEIRHMLDLTRANEAGSLVDQATAQALNAQQNVTPQLVCQAYISGRPAPRCTDSVKMGYLFVGGGFGLWYDVQKYVALILDINLLGAIGVGPGGQSGMNIDFQLGLGVHFL